MPKKKRGRDQRAFWTADSETDPFKKWRTRDQQRVPHAFIWGVYTGASMHYCDTVKQLVDMIKDQEVIVYFHNMGKFDAHVPDHNKDRVLDFINLREEMKIIDGRLVAANIGKAEIRDSWNLFPAPLREFGSKLDIDYRKLEADVRHKHMAEIKRYLAQDCAGLWNALQGFEDQYGRHLTQAGASMSQWELLSGRPAPATDAAYFAKFRPFYYGGRVQAFERGHLVGPFGVRDIRSAYPRAMLDQHPYSPDYLETAYPRSINGPDMVTLDCVSNGALPWREGNKAMVFPTDGERRRYYVTGWEVLAAQATGSLSEVEYINAVRFGGTIDFSVYINHFYALRKKYRETGNTAYAFFAKILMNSLYGKFGANPTNYGSFMCVPWDEKLDYEAEGYKFNGQLGKHAVVRADLDDWQQHFINVATAASITGWVRAFLWRNLAGSTRPIYCDTDCIIAQDFPADMQLGTELGQWNHEGNADEAWIAGKKMYYLQGDFGGKTEKMAAKGIKPDGRKIRLAAEGRVVTARSASPTFSLSGRGNAQGTPGVTFQERRIRMT